MQKYIQVFMDLQFEKVRITAVMLLAVRLHSNTFIYKVLWFFEKVEGL